jgi:ACS family pantothenate transporter-like MFS transporter
MDQNVLPGGQPFSLYLKAKSPEIYSVVRVNTLPTIVTAVSIVVAFTAGVVADKTGRFWLPSYVVTVPVLVGMVLLVTWDIGESGRLAGFFLTGFEGGESYFTYQFFS